jgi:hypothetical protein
LMPCCAKNGMVKRMTEPCRQVKNRERERNVGNKLRATIPNNANFNLDFNLRLWHDIGFCALSGHGRHQCMYATCPWIAAGRVGGPQGVQDLNCEPWPRTVMTAMATV